ncbi:MAG: ribosomal protein S18-alanine N-acetyltransferase [Gemmatimonadota bacterium]
MDAPCRIRQAGSADTDALLDLERACFSDPWSEPGMREVLGAPSTIALAADTGSVLSGYAVARSVAGAAEILTFGVLPRFHRRGIARELLSELLARLGSAGVTEVWLEVRISNWPARTLYESSGFRVAGMRRAYYRLPIEDAVVYRLVLSGGA